MNVDSFETVRHTLTDRRRIGSRAARRATRATSNRTETASQERKGAVMSAAVTFLLWAILIAGAIIVLISQVIQHVAVLP